MFSRKVFLSYRSFDLISVSSFIILASLSFSSLVRIRTPSVSSLKDSPDDFELSRSHSPRFKSGMFLRLISLRITCSSGEYSGYSLLSGICFRISDSKPMFQMPSTLMLDSELLRSLASKLTLEIEPFFRTPLSFFGRTLTSLLSRRGSKPDRFLLAGICMISRRVVGARPQVTAGFIIFNV